MDDQGIPALIGPPASGFTGTLPKVPIGTYYGSPDRAADHVQAEDDSLTLTFDQRLWGRAKLHEVARGEHYNLDRNNVLPTGVFVPAGSPFNGDLGTVWVTRSDRHILRHENDLFNQVEFSDQLQAGPIAQHVLAGCELGRQTAGVNSTQYADPAVVLLNPALVDPPVGEAPSSSTMNAVLATTAGFYLQDRIDLGAAWKALVGIRWDSFCVTQNGLLPPFAELGKPIIRPVPERAWSGNRGRGCRFTAR